MQSRMGPWTQSLFGLKAHVVFAALSSGFPCFSFGLGLLSVLVCEAGTYMTMNNVCTVPDLKMVV